MSLGYNYGLSLGRKRVVISNDGNGNSSSSTACSSPLKRLCSGKFTSNTKMLMSMSRLEALPQDLLIRVLCHVEHDNLEQLFRVSTTIKESTEIAKLMHFDVHTPKKQVTGLLHDAIKIRDANEIEEIQTPKAPLRRKYKSKLNGRNRNRNLAGITIALFPSDE